MKYKKRCEHKKARFVEQIKNIAVDDLVYIDETGIDNNIAPLRGWAKSGVRSFTQALGFRTKRITLIAGYCYSSRELIAPMEYAGYTNSELFLTWIDKCLSKELKPGQLVIMDNASLHKSSKVEKLIEKLGCSLIYLPAYSPDMNPIEKVWANLKRLLRKNPQRENNLSAAITDSMGDLIIG